MKRQYLIAFTLSMLLIVTVSLPFAAHAWNIGDPIVPCGTAKTHPDCNFADLVTLAQNVMGFLIFITIPIAAALFAFAGFKLITAGGDTGAIKEARKIFMNVVIGIVVMLVAYVTVYTIAKALVNSDYYSQLI